MLCIVRVVKTCALILIFFISHHSNKVHITFVVCLFFQLGWSILGNDHRCVYCDQLISLRCCKWFSYQAMSSTQTQRQLCGATPFLSLCPVSDFIETIPFVRCHFYFKGALWGLVQFSATESPLKMMTNAFYFTSKALFIFKIFKFLSWLFSHVLKRLYQKDKVNFKFYDVTAWLTNNCNTNIGQYLKK